MKNKKYSKFIASTMAFILVSIPVFLGVSFIGDSLNPKEWGYFLRTVFVVVELILIGLAIKS